MPPPANNTLDTLRRGGEVELETLQQMRDGSVALFDGLIAETHKRHAALAELEETSNACKRPGANSTVDTLQFVLSKVRAEIQACRTNISETHNRYEQAYDDAHAECKRNIEKSRCVSSRQENAADGMDLHAKVLEYWISGAIDIPDDHEWFRSHFESVQCVTNARNRILQLESQMFPNEEHERQSRDAAVDRSWKQYEKEKAALELQIADLAQAEVRMLAELQALGVRAA
ncbi:hypothetical protein BU23DRAFT_651022 [Bimuria novae-zelandiae CBS 107.79]|uniref:Uncharacterized protein n=1 Tax=Bimuria novae-zelandiae CBS 107.79 TaxID=1447943 RepID=A0A6A5VN72_9PLEO|nr:hypothetical protein BU23DRAFT_651022 [Bimuria novae-zelandiae CBS 107.79]